MPKVSVQHEQMRRQQILDAALTCFGRRGYHATSMEEIVRESGLSVGTLYAYFPSKEELFQALADEQVLRSEEQFRSMLMQGPVRQRLERALDHFFDTLDDTIGPWTRLSTEFWSRAALGQAQQERCRAGAADMVELFASMLREGMASGEIRSDVDPRAGAELLLAIGDGLILHWLQGGLAMDRDRLKQAVQALVGNGLFAQETRRGDQTVAPPLGEPPLVANHGGRLS